MSAIIPISGRPVISTELRDARADACAKCDQLRKTTAGFRCAARPGIAVEEMLKHSDNTCRHPLRYAGQGWPKAPKPETFEVT